MPQLSDSRFHGRAALVEAPPLLAVQLAIVVHLGAEFFRLGLAIAQVRLARFLQNTLIAERLLLSPQFLAHAFKARAEGCQHGLLSFQRRRALIQLGDHPIVFLLLLRQPFGIAHQTVVPFIELRRLLLQIARVALQLLVTVIDLQRGAAQLLLPLFERGLNAIEPDEIGLMLLLPLLQLGLRLGRLRFAGLHFPEALAQLALHFLLPADDEAMLFFEQLLFALDLLAASLDFKLFLLPFLLRAASSASPVSSRCLRCCTRRAAL